MTMIPGLIPPAPIDAEGWIVVKESNPLLLEIYRRHYSCVTPNAQMPSLGVGGTVCLLHATEKALVVWRQFAAGYYKGRTYLQCYRNETGRRGAPLLLETEPFVPSDWGRNAISFVDSRAVKGDGKCFKMAGWIKQKNRTMSKDLIIYEKTLDATKKTFLEMQSEIVA